MKQGHLFAFLLVVAIAVCANTQTSSATEAGTSKGHTKTKGTISGQAFIKSDAGTIRYAAGDTIWLVPDDEVSRPFLTKMSKVSVLYQEGVVNAIARSSRGRWTLGDSEGHFAFGQVFPGKYIVVACISWKTGEYGVDLAGGVAWADVVLPAAGHGSVIATGRYEDNAN